MGEALGKGRGRDLVALGAILAAAIWGTWLFVRSELNLGSGWTDGERQYASVRGERIRYAVWDTPAELLGEVNGLEAESQPAISPDGHWMVFSVGERGLNSDLFVAELVGGEVRDPRPLAMLNTGFDELAPAFGPDALYFSTDRGGAAFGLDLWRAPYADGVFSPAEAIGSGINTKSDESDPRPVPGTRALLFSSNRPRASRTDYDLYLAQPLAAEAGAEDSLEAAAAEPALETAAASQRRYEVLALDALNSPFDERDPTLTSDGRTLIFASDRDGSLGGFDLYRSFKEAEDWLPAKALLGVNSYRSERGPLLSADGFSLYFDVRDGEQLPDLWRAHSKELFRVPAGPLSIYEILGLLALMLLAILAYLSKRWRTIDVIYRCFLVSLLIHLFLMWYLREVYPESGPVETGGSERLFRVRLAPSDAGMPQASLERNGQLELSAQAQSPAAAEPTRAQEQRAVAAAAPSTRALERPESTPQEPARREAQLSEHRAQPNLAATMQDAEAPAERFSEARPELSVRSSETRAERAEVRSAQPERQASSAESAAPLRREPGVLTSARVAHQDQSDLGQAAPRAERLERLLNPGAPRGTRVEGPTESFQAASSDAPDMAMPELTLRSAPTRESGAAAPTEREHEAQPTPLGAALPSPGQLTPQVAEAERDALESAPRGPSLEPSSSSALAEAAESAELSLRELDEGEQVAPEASASPSFEATADLAQLDAQRQAEAGRDPSRQAFESRPAIPSQRAPAERRPIELGAAAQQAPLAQISSLEPSLSPTRREQAVAIRDIEESLSPASDEALRARRFDATAGLAPAEPRRFERKQRGSPVPTQFRSRLQVPAAEPTAKPMLAAAPNAEDRLPDEAPKRLERTPYQNRFGEEKLRALDEFGGTVETERAVAQGLAYLASIQNKSGSWGQSSDFDRRKYRDVRIGKSALALLAFLGAGHTPQAASEHSEVAKNSVRYLLGIQDAGTGHFGNSSSYGHGIATYALAECYALTRDEALRPAIERGIARILEQQDRRRDRRAFGGWGYFFRDNSIWDNDEWPRVSVTSWQVMALKSARIGGLEVPEEALEAAEAFLSSSWDERRGAYRYSHDPARLNSGYPILPASTPAALFGLSLLGNDISGSDLAAARRFVLERAPEEYRYRGADQFVYRARGNLYFWYYSTLAMFRVGGSEWSRWNAAMKSTLLESQSEDGSWRPLSTYSDFAGDDDDERTYSTALCVLSLEVYYRYFTPLLSK